VKEATAMTRARATELLAETAALAYCAGFLAWYLAVKLSQLMAGPV
jgi:hypothetical protein